MRFLGDKGAVGRRASPTLQPQGSAEEAMSCSGATVNKWKHLLTQQLSPSTAETALRSSTSQAAVRTDELRAVYTATKV